jgi:hypothetical protein
MTVKVMEVHEVDHVSNILVSEFEHITKKGTMSVLKVSVSQVQVCFVDQKCSETRPLVIPEQDLLDALHFTKVHCYQQHTSPYSDLFNIT